MVSISNKSSFLIGENYDFTFNQSIQHLVSEIRKETSDFSQFISTFYQLVQSKIDPPLESIWIYAALSFKSRTSTNDDLKNHISNAKELFRLISGCSCSCSPSKSIALLAPLVFQLHKLVKNLGAQIAKKTAKEVSSLIGAVLGYISVCCSKGESEESDSNLGVCVVDLVGIWMDGKGELKEFLPLVSDGIRREISVEGISVNSFAGVVVFEVFLLKLCFDLRVGIRGLELENELKNWIAGSITGFQSFYFFETLVRMLLEPTLPVVSLLSPEDEILLRKSLYDAGILVEYSFLRLEKMINLPADCVRSLAVKRLIITHKAIDYFRQNGDRKRAISYTSSFTNSQLPSQIIKFVNSQVGVEKEASKMEGASPKALIKWLLNLDSQGVRIFDDRICKSHAKSILDDSMTGDVKPGSKTTVKKTDADLVFYIDNQGKSEDPSEDDEEQSKSMNDAFVAAAQMMKNTENTGRKRKDERVSRRKKRAKVVRDDLSDNSEPSGAEGSLSNTDDSDSGSVSEVEHPISDDDVSSDE